MKFCKKRQCLDQPLSHFCFWVHDTHPWLRDSLKNLRPEAQGRLLPAEWDSFYEHLAFIAQFRMCACVCIKHNLQHLLSVDERHIHLIHIEKILFTAWSTWNLLSDCCTTIEWQTCAVQSSGNCHVYKWEQCPLEWKMLLAVSDSFSNRHLTPNSHSWLVSRWFRLSLSKQLFGTDTELMAYWHTAISKHDTLHPSKYFSKFADN